MHDLDMNIYLQCEQNIQGVPPGTSSCFKLLNPSLDEVNQHCSIGNCD